MQIRKGLQDLLSLFQRYLPEKPNVKREQVNNPCWCSFRRCVERAAAVRFRERARGERNAQGSKPAFPSATRSPAFSSGGSIPATGSANSFLSDLGPISKTPLPAPFPPVRSPAWHTRRRRATPRRFSGLSLQQRHDKKKKTNNKPNHQKNPPHVPKTTEPRTHRRLTLPATLRPPGPFHASHPGHTDSPTHTLPHTEASGEWVGGLATAPAAFTEAGGARSPPPGPAAAPCRAPAGGRAERPRSGAGADPGPVPPHHEAVPGWRGAAPFLPLRRGRRERAGIMKPEQ